MNYREGIDFTGPCVHGRDPFTRCEACGDLEPIDAERALFGDIPRPLTRAEALRALAAERAAHEATKGQVGTAAGEKEPTR